jgi:hypothetical protein
MSRRAIVAIAVLGAAAQLFIYATKLAGLPIRSDVFIHHDPSLAATARDCCAGHFPDYTAMFRWPGTRRWVNPHPIGVAVLQAPFFLAAHALTRWTNLSPDGFSLYYQHASALGGLFWGIAGLVALRQLLRRHFTEGVAAAAIVALTFGTNLFHYLTYDAGYSHAYSFFLFAAFLSLVERWHRAPDRRTSLLLGLVAGLIVLVRHTNALFLLVLPLYGAGPGAGIRATIARLMANRALLAYAAATALVVIAPQLWLYTAATGRPFVSAYGELGFDFTNPRLLPVLFGIRKGLFFWSPILLLGLAGWILLVRKAHPLAAFAAPVCVFFLANTLLIASWWDWQFGGSYGHRGFVDVLPVFGLGLAGLFGWSADRSRAGALVAVAASAAIALSVFQMLQYWHGIVPISDTTWDDYRQLFLQWR